MSADTSPLGPAIVVIILVVGGLIAIILVYGAGRWFRSRYSPIKYVRSLLYTETPIELSTSLPRSATEERLRRELTRFAIPLVMSQRLIGTVGDGQLKVRLHHWFFANSAAPILVATIENVDGRTRVQGAFRFPLYFRYFMTFFFGFLLFWSAIGIPAGLIALLLGQPEGAAFVLMPFVMFCFGIAFIKLGLFFGKKDRQAIQAAIADAIGGNVA